MNFTLEQLAHALRAQFTGEATTAITGVKFDSRQVQAGDLFLALVAENDGHDYVEAALANGASAVLVDDAHDIKPEWPAIIVPDTLVGLQQLGAWHRAQVAPKVIAVTGSNGKTTTKDMIAAVVSAQFNTYKTPENFNNEIGVPLTLLQMPATTEVLVIELGMDRPGQISALSKLVQPDVAIITMIGEAHIEFFKTRDRIADAKLEIVDGLANDGVLIIPINEPLLTAKTANLAQRVVTFGVNEADVVATDIASVSNQTEFTVNEIRFAIPLLGLYNVNNALAALTSGHELGLTWAQMRPALTNFQLTKMRTEWMQLASGTRLLSDVYNSNPTAVSAVLATFKTVEAPVKRVVLGDMLELGDAANDLHAGLAQDLDPRDFQAVYLVGDLMRNNLYPKLLEKYLPEQLHVYGKDELSQLSADLMAQASENDVILLKASHGIHLENVVTTLQQA